MRTDCPICGGNRSRLFLQRQGVPVHQNLPLGSREEARAVLRGDLDMMVCADCGFVFNRAFDPSLMRYGPDYDNVQSHSRCFDEYLDQIVYDMVERRGVRDAVIVEVGCGKGEFLRKLVAHPCANNRGHGFDPSYQGPLTDLDGRLRFHRRFYDRECADVGADVVLCRHVIEHCQEPMDLLRSIRVALGSSDNARLFLETPSVEWIFENRVIWDFFYEHCSLFSMFTLRNAFERAGFAVERAERVFGGQYLWIEARVAPVANAVAPHCRDLLELAMRFAEMEAGSIAAWRQLLWRMSLTGPVVLWGAGAKGTTLANLIDKDCSLIDCLVDVNPGKQGRFVPGTGHPIIAPADLPLRKVRHAVLMNPNYKAEVMETISRLGTPIMLIEGSDG